jgi:competence protein ComEA
MGRPEHRAALLLLALGVAGQAVWTCLGERGEPPGEVRVLGAGTGGVQAHRDSAARGDRPLGPGERIDVDRAGQRELRRIPHVGPGLARAIVADRNARGPFGDLRGLDRVPGVGPGLLATIEPYVSFSGTPVPGPAGSSTVLLQGSTADCHPTRCSGPLLDLNSASAEELERLPGIGPSLASRIVAYRGKHGRFASVEELIRVGGIGPATLARVRDRIQAR